MPGLHSQLGPSSAHRYRKCPGSVRMTRDLPNTAGIEAAYGTVFHEFAAISLDLGVDPHTMVGGKSTVEQHGLIEFTLEMARKMLPGLDFLESLMGDCAEMYVEQKLDLSAWLGEGEFGTSDACIVDLENRRIVVFDWKWGAGVPVQPEMNDQAILYILGCWSTFAAADFEDDHIQKGGNVNDPWEDGIAVWIVIEQPRAPGGGGLWKTDLGTILAEGAKIKKDAAATREPDAPLIPGPDQCKFCAAAQFRKCPAERDLVLSKLDVTNEELERQFDENAEMDMPEVMSPKAVSQFLLHWDMIKKFHDRIHAKAYSDAENGKPPLGMMLVDGRNPPRSWIDDDKAEIVLMKQLGKEDAYTKKLLSPTQVEGWVGKAAYRKKFDHFVAKGEPKPQLVPTTDGRDPKPDRMSRLDALMGEETDSLL